MTRSYDDLAAAQRALHETEQRLLALLPAVGPAKADIEYDGERKKMALAEAVKVVRSASPTSAQGAAESEARTLPSYKTEIQELYIRFSKACYVDAAWRLGIAQVEIGRSSVSVEKTLAGMQ